MITSDTINCNIWDWPEETMQAAEEQFGLDYQQRPLSDMNIRFYPHYLAPALTHIHTRLPIDPSSKVIDRLPNYAAIFTALAYNANPDGLVAVSRPFLPNMLLMGGNDENLFIKGLRELLNHKFIKTLTRRTNPHSQRITVTYELNPFFTAKGSWPEVFRRRLLWGGMEFVDVCIKAQEWELDPKDIIDTTLQQSTTRKYTRTKVIDSKCTVSK